MGHSKTVIGEVIMQYLVAIHHPDDYDPAIAEDEEMERDIDVLNEEMIAAGVRLFAGGLHPARSAKSQRAQPGGSTSESPPCRAAFDLLFSEQRASLCWGLA